MQKKNKDLFFECISSAENMLYDFNLSEDTRKCIRDKLHEAKLKLMEELIIRYALEETSLNFEEIKLLNSLGRAGIVYRCSIQSEFLQSLIKKGYVLELEDLVFVSEKYIELRQKC